MSTSSYFKIIGATAADTAILQDILSKRTFYPNATTDPALPALADADPVNFDYRQLFRFVGIDTDGGVIVHTRSLYSVADWDTKIVPTAEWTASYRLSAPPTIALSAYSKYDANGRQNETTLDVFKSYNYPPYLNN